MHPPPLPPILPLPPWQPNPGADTVDDTPRKHMIINWNTSVHDDQVSRVDAWRRGVLVGGLEYR